MVTIINYNTLCECGHTLEDHHNSMICDGLVYDGQNNEVVPFDPTIHKKFHTASVCSSWYCLENRTDFPHAHGEECEYWGFNETGGLKPVGVNGVDLYWIQNPNSDHEHSHILDGEIDSWVQHCNGFKGRHES